MSKPIHIFIKNIKEKLLILLQLQTYQPSSFALSKRKKLIIVLFYYIYSVFLSNYFLLIEIISAVWYNYFIRKSVNNFLNFKFYFMGNILYIIAVILIIGWLLGVFAFHVAGGLIHILLVIAIIAIILQVIRGNRTGI